MKRLLTLVLSTALGLPASAGVVTLTGHAPDYAGLKLVVSAYADFTSRLKRDLVTIEIDGKGDFRAQAEIADVTYASIDLSYYEGSIYLEPGATYDILLPRRRLRPDAERFNPFYRPLQTQLVIKGASSNLNAAIRAFDLFWNRVYYDGAIRLVRGHDRALCDRLLQRTDSAARAANCPLRYFTSHVKYRQAQIFAAPRLASWQTIFDKYFAGSPVLFNLPAYWQAIDMVNPDILTHIDNADTRKAVRQEMRKSQPTFSRLSELLAREPIWRDNQTLREALLIRSLQRMLFDKQISSGRADSLLIGASANSHSLQNRLMAANIYARKNKLREGLPAPELNLTEGDKEVTLQDFKGKWVYLAFMHTENYECVKAFPALDNLAGLHEKDLQIICVFTDDDADEMRRLLQRQKWRWMGVSYISNQKLMFDYDIRGLPTYFLIDPDGLMSVAQAPGPLEKVGPVIANAIRSYKANAGRGKVEIPRTIYDIATGGGKP